MKGKRKNQNYCHNLKQTVPRTALGEHKLIVNQARQDAVKYGRLSSNRNGCGWIAIVNAMELLGEPVSVAETIHWLESQPPLYRPALGGYLGTFVWTPVRYFRSQGYQVSVALLPEQQKAVAEKADVCLGFYARIPYGHFVTFQGIEPEDTTENAKEHLTTPQHKRRRKYHFINDIYGKTDDYRTLDQFWKDNKAIVRVVIGISKLEQKEHKTGQEI